MMAAGLLGLKRQAVYQRVQHHPVLQELLREIEEEEKDRFEALVKDMAENDKHPTMVLAWLNAKARERGWGRYGMDVNHQQTITHVIDPKVAKLLSALSDREVATLEGIFERLDEVDVEEAEPGRSGEDAQPQLPAPGTRTKG